MASVCQTVYIPPEPVQQNYAEDYVHVQNNGQLTDSDGNQVPNVKFYTHSNTPLTFFSSDKVSFAYLDKNDITQYDWYRVDMQFVCEAPDEINCIPTLHNLDKTHYLNHYYLENTGATGITEVRSYQRLVYENAFQDIDFHFLSNELGPKLAIVIHENADPSKIKLNFTGQDSLINANSGVRAYLNAFELELPDMLAYEVDNGNITLKSWAAQWHHDGNGNVEVQLGSYDHSRKLVLLAAIPLPSAKDSRAPENNDWSTYLGGFADFDEGNSVVTDELGNVYIGGKTGSPDFPTIPGANPYSPATFGATDGFICKFDPDGELLWTNFIGGDGDDEIRAIALDTSRNIAFTAHTTANDMITNCNGGGRYCQTYSEPLFSNEIDGFVGVLTNNGQQLLYGSYYGDTLDENFCIGCLFVDDNNNIYFAGSVGGAFPTYATGTSFLQTSNNSQSNGLIVKMNNGIREWSTLFGSDQFDYINTISGRPDGTVYVGGGTSGIAGNNLCGTPTNGGFPLCDKSGNADYYQNSSGGAFLAEFNSNEELTWSTFFGIPGGLANSNIRTLKLDSEGRLYFTALMDSGAIDLNDCDVPTSGVPLCTRAGAYTDNTFNGNADLLVGRFDTDLSYDWGTLFGGTLGEVAWDMAISKDNSVYVTGRTESYDFPDQFKYGFYYQSSISDFDENRTDAFIIGFDSNGVYQWGTYYGGAFTVNQEAPFWRLNESANSVAVDDNDNIYIVGITPSKSFPLNCDPSIQYCRTTPSNAINDLDDGFVVRFKQANLLNVTEIENRNRTLEVYPNPTDREIWLNVPPSFGDNQTLRVIAPDGRLIEERTIQLNGPTKLDFSYLPVGVYIVTVSSNSEQLSTQIVKY